MKYNFFFDIAAIILNIALLLSIYIRRTYPTKACSLFKTMLWVNLISCSADSVSAVLVSYPFDYPIELNYFMGGTYLLFHNLTAICFLIYVIALIREEPLKFERIYLIAVSLYEVLVIVTNPMTHAIFFFDEGLNYCHGFLFISLYIVSFVTLFYSSVLFIRHREVITKYQLTIYIAFLSLLILAVLFQCVYPSILIETFCATISFYMMNVALDNPEIYFYNNTYCFNQLAFDDKIGKKIRKKKSFTLLAIHFKELKEFKKKHTKEEYDKVVNDLIEIFQSSFEQKNLFFLLNECFILRVENGKASNNANRVTQIFRNRNKFLKTNGLTLPHFCVLEYPGNYDSVTDVNEAISSMIFDVYRNTQENIVYNDDSILERKRREAYILKNLSNAILEDRFEMHYQPIYDFKNDRYISCEALLRLKDEEGNFISPEEFVPLAEKNGMILKIGDIVVNKVCQFIKNHKLEDLGLEYVEMNLSKVQLLDLDSVIRLVQSTKKYKVSPSQINLEITETADLNDVERQTVNDNISYLYGKGFRFSLDDFGRGFSDIGYIAEMPFNIVKIDKSILWNAVKNNRYKVVLDSSVTFIKEMGIKCIVEGVENKEMEDILLELNCDFFQGYYYSKPIDEKSLIEFVTKK